MGSCLKLYLKVSAPGGGLQDGDSCAMTPLPLGCGELGPCAAPTRSACGPGRGGKRTRVLGWNHPP